MVRERRGLALYCVSAVCGKYRARSGRPSQSNLDMGYPAAGLFPNATVRGHVKSILTKLDAMGRTEAIASVPSAG